MLGDVHFAVAGCTGRHGFFRSQSLTVIFRTSDSLVLSIYIGFVYRMRCKGQNPCSSMWIVCRFSVVDDLNCLGWKRIDRGHAGPPLGSRLLHWSARMWSCQCHVVLMAATLHTVWELASLCLLTLFYFLLNDLKL